MNKVEVRKANNNDEEGIIALLDKFYPGVPDHWRKIFAPRNWKIENDFPGFIIVNDNKIVGFLGTIFSEHETLKGKIKICNLTTWYIEPAYRQYGLALFAKVMKLHNVSWTNLTAAPHTYEWLRRSGFITLEDTQTLAFPIPKLYNKKDIEILLKIEEKHLDSSLQSIHRMHANLNCKPILIKTKEGLCYCLAVLTKYKKIPLAKIYYISDRNIFHGVISDIKFQLCLKLHVCYLVIEGDILNGKKFLGLYTKNIFPPRLFKSPTLSREEMSILCSELFILGI